MTIDSPDPAAGEEGADLEDRDRPPIIVRQYRPGDREAVRSLAVACADPDAVAPCLADHLPLVADMLISYYTDMAPDTLWVADAGTAGVVGYLAGGLRPQARQWAVAVRILPRVVLRAIAGGAVFRCPVRSMIRAGWATWRNALEAQRPIHDRYPAHFHIGVSAPHRGGGVGRALVEQFTEQAVRSGAGGICVSVYAQNAGARAFFSALGYREIGRYETHLVGRTGTIRKRVLILGRPVTAPGAPPEERWTG